MSVSSGIISKRKIQIVLGLLWILDGLLQLQHQMFSPAFANKVIDSAGQGQAALVTDLVNFATHIILINPVLFDVMFVAIQLSIGLLILNKSTTKYGLYGSVFWGISVWIFGEGLGGLTTGHTLLLLGTPGAALLYAIIALGVNGKLNNRGEVDKKPAYWLAIIWAVLWLGGSLLQLVNGQNTAADMSGIISYMAKGSPGWMASIDTSLATRVLAWGGWFIIFIIIAQATIGILILFNRRIRLIAIIAGILLSAIFWVVGQNLGDYYSGLMTDPNTGPLVILLGVAILGSDDRLLARILGDNKD